MASHHAFQGKGKTSLRSKRFRLVSEQTTRDESQRPRQKLRKLKSREGWLSFHFSRCEIRKCPSSVFLCSETKEKLKDRFARTAALIWNGLPKSLKSLRKSQLNPLNPNFKIQILICYLHTFSIEVVRRIY